MTKRSDFIGQLEEYLEDFDGETPLPDRIRDALHAELPGTHQVRPVAGRWKGPNMSSTTPKIARWGLVAAGLVVAVGLGAAIMLPGRSAGVGAAVASPTAAPTPVPTPATSPSATSTLKTLAGATQESCDVNPSVACIVAGTYLLGPVVPGAVVDVPAGWWEWNPGAGSVGLLVERDDAASGSGWGVVVMQVGDVSRDPCDPSAGTLPPEEVDTPDELRAAMTAWPGFEVSKPETMTVAGKEAVWVRVTSIRSTGCNAPMIWETPAGIPIDGYPMVDGASETPGEGYPAEFRIIDVDGQLVAIRTLASAATSPFESTQGIAQDPVRHAADLVDQQAIVDSIRFEAAAP